MDVELVRWPLERLRRDELHRCGRPRLLLLEDGMPPPPMSDDLEDWIRVPYVDGDLAARLAILDRRASGGSTVQPVLDEGVLRMGQLWVSLAPVEAKLMSALLARYRAVVSREALCRAAWPTATPPRNALDVHVVRLRRRLPPLPLALRTVRSRGYLLEPAAPATSASSQ